MQIFKFYVFKLIRMVRWGAWGVCICVSGAITLALLAALLALAGPPTLLAWLIAPLPRK